MARMNQFSGPNPKVRRKCKVCGKIRRKHRHPACAVCVAAAAKSDQKSE